MYSDWDVNRELRAKFARISQRVHLKNLEHLKLRSDTLNATDKYQDVIDFVSKSENSPEVQKAIIYSTTIDAIESIKKYALEQIKTEFKNEKRNIEYKINNQEIAVLKEVVRRQFSPAAFFSIPSKEIYVVENFVDKHFYSDPKKKKSGQESISKFYCPKRFSLGEWIGIHNQASVAHELFHLLMDSRAAVRSEGLHEEYAYSHMVGYGLHIGLSEEEIINGFLLNWGYIKAGRKNPTISYKQKKKEWKKEALIEAKKLYDQYMNQHEEHTDKFSAETDNQKPINFEMAMHRKKISLLEL